MSLLDVVGSLGGILSDISAFSNPFGPPSKGQWNLSKCLYTSSKGKQIILFTEIKGGGEPKTNQTAVDQIVDGGGRRLAIYEYPYLDGQAVRDLGRKGETYTFNFKFFGDNYQLKFQDFLKIVVADDGQGTLIHPVLSAVRGSIKVRFHTYENIHRHDEWNSVTVKAVFIEDSTGSIQNFNKIKTSTNSALRSALQALTNAQAAISSGIFEVGALLLLPSAIQNSFSQRLSSIVGQSSRLLGQLAATFSSDAQIQALSAQASRASSSVPGLKSGITTSGTSLPPVFQVGFDPTTQQSINNQTDAYINANQITPQQAVFSANQVRALVSKAIEEINNSYGNYGYDIILQYRGLAISIQESVESSISSAQQLVKIYKTTVPMSLRRVAKENNLDPDRQNDIELLNPYLESINYIPAGTELTVPIS